MEPNVHFWKQIYSEYPTTKGILHDSVNVHLIYDIIDLKAPDSYGARKINRKRTKEAKKRIKRILLKLARNPKTADPEAVRVAGLFGSNANSRTFKNAIHRIRCQLGQKDRFREGIIRSGAYIDEIKEICRKHHIPEDLAYLPHVESSFNPKACSKHGAAGIWQFTRSTGKRFMTVNYTLDERRDPILSSRAAAKLLKQNYNIIGNWPLAITAYNHGMAGILRAVRRKGGYEDIFKAYRSRIFKFASRNFYSEFLAARDVAKNYLKHFGPLALDKPPETIEIPLNGYACIRALSEHLKVDMKTIRKFNPALRAPVFSGQKYIPKGYDLRLPARITPSFFAGIPGHIYMDRQKPTLFYRVRRGDTVSKIAMMHGLKISDIIIANNLNARGTIYVNQKLCLPVPGETPAPPARSLHAGPALASLDLWNRIENKAPKSKTQVLASKAGNAPSEFSLKPIEVVGDLRVQRVHFRNGKPIGIIRIEVEETLGHYAQWLGIPTQALRRLNGFRYGRQIRLHQKIKIPLDKVSKEAFEEARLAYRQKIQKKFFAANKIHDVRTYRVKNGDNIWTLCYEKFNMPLWLLKKYNPDTDFTDLRHSQKLNIPLVVSLLETDSDTPTTLEG